MKNAAWRVTMCSELAGSSWWRGTTSGIIAISAGPKNVDSVEMTAVITQMIHSSWGTTSSSRNRAPRAALATTRMSRLSSRSTYTPAMAPKMTAGTRKLRMSRLTLVDLPVSWKTSTVSPKRTMLPPTWVTTWAIQSDRNLRLRRTAIADSCGTATVIRRSPARRSP